jgi:phospholipid transport system substrate-binding protein
MSRQANNRRTRPGRRGFLAALAAGALTMGVWRPALAFTVSEARNLIQALVDDINEAIYSKQSQAAMIRDFERILERYADVDIIARSVLGPPARSASAAQMNAYIEAFKGYIARKYGKRFREFDGGRIRVEDARPLKSFYEVITTAFLSGQKPFEVRFHASDRGGRPLFFNIIIEGVNMLATERTEIGAMLDQNGGSMDRLTEALRRAG